MFCKNCGNELVPGAKFCDKCGETISEGIITNQEAAAPSEVNTASVYDLNVEKNYNTVPLVQQGPETALKKKKKSKAPIFWTIIIILAAIVIALCVFKDVFISDIKISSNEYTLDVGDEQIIDYTVNPSFLKDCKMNFTSSNAEVADVDENGKITAKSAGNCTVSISTRFGKKSDISIIVNKPDDIIGEWTFDKVVAVPYNSADELDWDNAVTLDLSDIKDSDGVFSVPSFSCDKTGCTYVSLFDGETYSGVWTQTKEVDGTKYYSIASADSYSWSAWINEENDPLEFDMVTDFSDEYFIIVQFTR